MIKKFNDFSLNERGTDNNVMTFQVVASDKLSSMMYKMIKTNSQIFVQMVLDKRFASSKTEKNFTIQEDFSNYKVVDNYKKLRDAYLKTKADYFHMINLQNEHQRLNPDKKFKFKRPEITLPFFANDKISPEKWVDVKIKFERMNVELKKLNDSMGGERDYSAKFFMIMNKKDNSDIKLIHANFISMVPQQ